MDESIFKHDKILGEFFKDLCGILIEWHWNCLGSQMQSYWHPKGISHRHLEATTVGQNLGFSTIVHKILFFPDRYNHQLALQQFSVSVKKVLVPIICFEKKVVVPYACLHKKVVALHAIFPVPNK